MLFSLASWDPHTQLRVQDWLAGQLTQTYPDLRAFGSDVAQKLVDQGRLLPVLDGLDEIPAERRSEVIGRLNASLHLDTGVIVTSRSTEYTETVRAYDVLTAAAVIEPEPLTPREVTTYLKALLPRQLDDSWQTVLTALRDGTAGALAEVVASPLGLWLLRIVHIDGRRDPQPLIDPGRYPDAAALQHHLLEELIPATIRSRQSLPSGKDPLRPAHDHDPEQVRQWLTTLAIELRDAKTRDWRWWQLARHTLTTRQIELAVRRASVLVFVLASMLVGMLALGLLGGLRFGLVGMLVFGLGSGLGSGLVVGLLSGLSFGLATSKTCWPAFVITSLWLRARRRLPLRLMGFLDDAYRLGLLRIVGPVYQFRHAVLQDHLAPPAESMAAPSRRSAHTAVTRILMLFLP